MKSVKLYVPATIGNVGPGFDVLGLALEGLGNTYELSLCEGESRVLEVTGIDADRVPSSVEQNVMLLAAQQMAQSLGHQEAKFAVRVHQELPVGGGLGSSAAACLAGAYAVPLLLGEGDFGLPQILKIAHEFEGHYDNLAPAYYGGLTIASHDFIQQVPQGCDLWIVIVTPKNRLETKVARSVLPKELPQADWVRQMALSCALVCAWQQGDLEGILKALQDPYAEPRRAPLMPGFYKFKQTALDSGALGCSISGAGPTLFSIFGDESKAQTFAQQHQGHIGQVAKQGIRVC